MRLRNGSFYHDCITTRVRGKLFHPSCVISCHRRWSYRKDILMMRQRVYWIRFETFNQLYTITFNLCKKVSSFFNEFVTIRKLSIQKYYKTEYLIWSLAILQILDVTGQIKFWRQTLLYGNQTKIVFLELLLYNFTWTQTQPTKNFDVKRLWTELNDLRCQGRSYCGEVRKNCVLLYHFHGRSWGLWTGRSDLLGTTEVERTVQARATHRLNPP